MTAVRGVTKHRPNLPETLDPLGQRLRAPAERRVGRRFVPAPRLVAGHDPGEVGAQARHGGGEAAHGDANERALFRPGQLVVTALHTSLAAAGGSRWRAEGRRDRTTATGQASRSLASRGS